MTTELYNQTKDQTQQPATMTSIALKWAVIGILLSIIQVMTTLYLNDGKYNPRGGGWIAFLVGLALIFFILIMPIKEYKEKSLGGYISFGKAFACAFRTSLFLILFSVIFYLIFYNFVIDWDTFMSEQMEIGIKAMKDSGMSDSEIQNRMSGSPSFFGTQWFSLIIVAFIGLLFDTIISLISAAIMKKDPPRN